MPISTKSSQPPGRCVGVILKPLQALLSNHSCLHHISDLPRRADDTEPAHVSGLPVGLVDGRPLARRELFAAVARSARARRVASHRRNHRLTDRRRWRADVRAPQRVKQVLQLVELSACLRFARTGNRRIAGKLFTSSGPRSYFAMPL